MTKTKKALWGTAAIALLLALTISLLYLFGGLHVQAKELSKGYKPNTPLPEAYTDAFVTQAADFSFALYAAMATQAGENTLLSPLSALCVLGMLSLGAGGDTLAQMEAAVGMDKDALCASLAAFERALEGTKAGGIHLENSIWIRDTFAEAVKSSFLQANANYFGAQIYAAPFDGSTVRDMNRWVEHYTDGLIDKIIDGEAAPAAVMYLMNTLALDFKWDVGYRKSSVSPLPFFAASGDVQSATGLSSEESLYLDMPGAQGFAKPYKNGDFYFIALLPQEGSTPESVLAGLSGNAWLSMWEGRQAEAVQVTIPEFAYDREMELTKALSSMGIVDLFDSQRANLSSLSESPLFCSLVKQKTMIDVSRAGTKAAAVTMAEVKCMSAGPRLSLVFNRPFAYAVVDAQSGLPLFLGTVNAIH